MTAGLNVENTFQTNGILLDDDWCRFFHQNNFLIGLVWNNQKNFTIATARTKVIREPLNVWCVRPGCSRNIR